MPAQRSQPSLGEYLVREGIITQKQLDGVIAEQRKTLVSMGRVLVDQDLITEEMRISILQKKYGFELATLKGTTVDPQVLGLIPYVFADKHHVVPIRREPSGVLVVGMEDPTDMMITEAIRNQIGIDLEPAIVSLVDLQKVLNQYPKPAAGTVPAPDAVPKKRKVYRPTYRDAKWFRLLKVTSLPALVLLPLAMFMLALWFGFWGVGKAITNLRSNSTNPNFDMFLYIALIWGMWSIIIFEICGLIFSEKKPGEDEA